MNITAIFNNREIATIIWLFLFALFALKSKDDRVSFAKLLKTYLSVKILLPIFFMAIFLVGIIYLLNRGGLWNVMLLKDTILWFFLVGQLTMFKYVMVPNGNIPIKNQFLENLKLIVVFEFIVNLFTFSLLVELILVPVITIILIMNNYVQGTNGDRGVGKLLVVLQSLLGLVVMGYALYIAIVDYRVIGTLDMLRSFLLPILLSVAIIPVAYMFAVYAKYESLFVGFKIGKLRESSYVRYCKWRVILHCGLSTRKIARLRPFDLMDWQSKHDVVDMLKRRDEADKEEVFNT